MTTAAFNRMAPHVRRALAAVKEAHCRPPTFAPAAPIDAHRKCPCCGSRLNYTVSLKGITYGRCVRGGCVKWDAQ